MDPRWKNYIVCEDDSLGLEITLRGQSLPFSVIGHGEIKMLIEDFRLSETLRVEFQNWLKSGDLSRAKLIREKQKIYFNNYGEVEFSFPIDWKLGLPENDNLNWQLHSMVFLRDLALAHRTTSNTDYLKLIKALISEWSTQNVTENYPSPFSWNDHSTAYRLFALTNVLIYWFESEPGDLEFIKLLLSIIGRHWLVLMDENFYSKGTNHGLDQSFFLYISSNTLTFISKSAQTSRISFERLRYEVLSSFSDDGVHVENSPEYHDIVFYNVIKINKIVSEIESINLIENFDSFCKKALRFLTFILRPDGCWPPIGDSTTRGPRYTYENLSHLPEYDEFIYTTSKGQKGVVVRDLHAVFPTSGYFIMRSHPHLLPYEKGIHIVFKCGFLSHYHRHDDDNNILIFGLGEEWLTEGGLYKHSLVDPQRIHMRSPFAHNLMIPSGVNATRDRNNFPTSGLVHFSTKHYYASCKGTTKMFPGFIYEREVSYDSRKILYVTDTLQKVEKSQVQSSEQYWHIPMDKDIEILENEFLIISKASSFTLRISIESKNIKGIEKLEPSENPYFCWRSIQYDTLEPINVVKVSYRFDGIRISSRAIIEWLF